MRAQTLLAGAFVATSAWATDDMDVIEADTRDWRPLSGAEVLEALTDRTLRYPTSDARQTFFASGKTKYTFGGRDSWGYWRVDTDAYCSQWPPSDLWTCYDVGQFKNSIRFVAPGPDVSEGVYDD